MFLVKRVALIALLLCVPLLFTAAMYAATRLLLNATSRTIDPQILWYAAAIELLLFFFVGVLEVRDRW